MFNLNQGLWYYLTDVIGFANSGAAHIALTVTFAAIAMLSGYLLGSINSAIIVSKLLHGDDIRNHGSGNAGLTNMLRTYGKKAAGLTLLGDVLKTAVSIFIGGLLGGFGYIGNISLGCCDLPLAYMAGFFAIIGHIWPIYYGLKGGKGVLCTAAMALILTPIEFVILIVIFILIVLITKYVSLGSVTVAILYPVVVSAHFKVFFAAGTQPNGVMMLITMLIAILVVYCHRENLKRISNGTERKLSVGGKKKNSEKTEETDT